MAIEDGVVLGRCFSESPEPTEALRRYEAARKERANWVLIGSRAQGLRYQSDDPEHYDEEKHKYTDSTELFSYNAATAPV